MDSSGNNIRIYGAREHNLKGVSLELPRDALVVFCGVSGSGKSSLAFDTLYAEGQRRYVESLSAGARQFLGELLRPQVDHIDGLSPAVAIDQNSSHSNPRSTVATLTDIYDYLRVMFAKVGLPHCYQCGDLISARTPSQITDELESLPEQTRLTVLAPLTPGSGERYAEVLRTARRRGYARVRLDGELRDLAESIRVDENEEHHIELVVDRLVVGPEVRTRLAEAVEVALEESSGMVVAAIEGEPDRLFSNRFACTRCGLTYPELTPQLFSFNHPSGYCPTCGGLGVVTDTAPERLVRDPEVSLLDGALHLVGAPPAAPMLHLLEGLAEHYGFDLHTPWNQLTESVRQALLFGSEQDKISYSHTTKTGRQISYEREFEGLVPMVTRRHEQTESRHSRDFYEQFRAPRPCPACHGARLRPEALAVTVGGQRINEICSQTIEASVGFFAGLSFAGGQELVTHELLKDIRARLGFLAQVGLGYLTLDRSAPTLAGGEAQRIRLANQVGSGLAGIIYILDEPSIGLHPRDHERLLEVLAQLRDRGNTLVVVEHDPPTILAADYVVEFGPGAGTQGGEVIFAGTVPELLQAPHSLTGQYLSGRRHVPHPTYRRPAGDQVLWIRGAREHNLQNLDVALPLGLMICVTGVSGSGKSTLISDILYPALRRRLHRSHDTPGAYDRLEGVEYLDKVVSIDQRPIGRSPRSNPATYSGVFGPLRELFSQTPAARMRGYGPGRFSFNVRGGRCEACAGEGTRRVEMHFLPDVRVPCPECGGTRYNRETLQVRYKGKDIAEVLDLTIQEALELFANQPALARVLRTLCEVGLDYIKLGQPANTLSGGEAQRLKLARELSRPATSQTLYLLDEPTTGLHFVDIEKLLEVLQRLVDAGNTVVIIEHNLEVIRNADYVIDLGPEGGDGGGRLLVSGTPEQVAAAPGSHTGRFLQAAMAAPGAPPEP
ncbi:MAG TPA: excinuclease ABC subunit UvrA [Armatimonadota bacterium]|jgi:excinuclease ABC subunit A